MTWFRNLRIYLLPQGFSFSDESLHEKLSRFAFTPCRPFESERSGWVSPIDDDQNDTPRLVFSSSGTQLLKLRRQERILPTAAINEILEEREREFAGKMGRKASRSERQTLAESVRDELMPQALVKSAYTSGYISEADGLIVIDAGSAPAAETFLDRLRDALQSLPVTPIQYASSVSSLLAAILLGRGPTGWSIGDACFLRDPAAGSTEVRYRKADLSDATVTRQVEGGLRVAALDIRWRDQMSCALNEEGCIARLKFDGVEEADSDDPATRLEANMAIMVLTLRAFLKDLANHLGGIEGATAGK